MQRKSNDKNDKNRRFGVFMTPLWRRSKITKSAARYNNKINIQCLKLNYVNTLARIESLCTFRVGSRPLMKSISFAINRTYQSTFFQNAKTPQEVFREFAVLFVVVFIYWRCILLMSIYPHVCVIVRAYSPHNPQIAQVTLKTINDALLVDDLWLRFAYFKVLPNFAL